LAAVLSSSIQCWHQLL